MNRLLLSLFALVLNVNVFAGKSPIKYGDIPREDLKMNSYEPNSSAATVILSDYGQAYVSVSAVNAVEP